MGVFFKPIVLIMGLISEPAPFSVSCELHRVKEITHHLGRLTGGPSMMRWLLVCPRMEIEL